MSLRRAAVIALLVLLMAVTPLSSVLSGGAFETWLSGDGHNPTVRVLLNDHTGLVKALFPSVAPRLAHEPVSNPASNRSVLAVSVEGSSCDYRIQLTFDRSGEGFVIRGHTDEVWCYSGSFDRTVALTLWAPVDASTVRYEFAGYQQPVD